ncbi:MAG: hypothetical protein EBT97_08235, partial [Actinobacteria bacterium]|nr:hypothetical protein [Actinomycetota bacterium]
MVAVAGTGGTTGAALDVGVVLHTGAARDALSAHGVADSERELGRWIQDFNHAVSSSCENYRPSTLANHLFYLCKAFNRFYTDVPVLKATDAGLRDARLVMVAAKRTLKDRWRQVLREANRTEHKHLLTLDSDISEAQLEDMQAAKVIVAMPKSIRDT